MEPLFAGVDLGGTAIKCALGTASGAVTVEQNIDTRAESGPDDVLRRIADTVLQMTGGARRRPRSLGMGVPGLVDLQAGLTRFLPNFPGHWRGVEAARIVSERVGCPVQLLNDVRTATLGELVFGHGRGVGTMAFFALGTGVGGGVVIDGKLRLGPLGAAGELGHMTIVPDGPPCGCGSRGCLETVVGAPAIISEGIRLMRIGLAPRLGELVEGDITRITPREVALAARQGDDNVRDAVLRAAGFLGLAVANVVTVLHPELVVIGGGVANMGDLIFDRVRDVVRQDVRMFPADDVRIEPSFLGERAGVMGALALASRGLPG
jgi:glucokinase